MRLFLRSRIERATVTSVNSAGESFIGLDEHLMNAAGLMQYERVSIHNTSSGQQFDAFVVGGAAGSGEVSLNGAFAQSGSRGDIIVITSYGALHAGQILDHKPRVVVVGKDNRVLTLAETTISEP